MIKHEEILYAIELVSLLTAGFSSESMVPSAIYMSISLEADRIRSMGEWNHIQNKKEN